MGIGHSQVSRVQKKFAMTQAMQGGGGGAGGSAHPWHTAYSPIAQAPHLTVAQGQHMRHEAYKAVGQMGHMRVRLLSA